MKTKVAFLKEASDKDLKKVAYAKPPKINFHKFNIGEVIYRANSYAEEMYIIVQGTVEIRFQATASGAKIQQSKS